MVVVGNGGIATELVYEIENCEILWAIKDETITHTFIDAGAATFFLPRLSKVKTKSEDFRPVKRSKYEVAGECKNFWMQKCSFKILLSYTADETQRQPEEASVQMGSALGPDWHDGLKLKGLLQVRFSFESS